MVTTYLWVIAGLLFIIAIAIHPMVISFVQDSFGTWEQECEKCGATSKCYPVKQRGLQTGMISTVIEISCPNCGKSTDPYYAAHISEMR